MNDTTDAERLSPGRPSLTDLTFLASMVLMLVMVAWVGKLSYLEGMKTEVSKRNGEAWAKWLSETGIERFKDDYGLPVCSGGPARLTTTGSEATAPDTQTTEAVNTVAGTPATTRDWGECLRYLTTPPGPLAGLRNPFLEAPLVIAPKCDPADRSLTGALILEKLVPTPPGSSIPFVTSQLLDKDPIEQKIQIRVTVCDKGAYPIRVAEVEF